LLFDLPAICQAYFPIPQAICGEAERSFEKEKIRMSEYQDQNFLEFVVKSLVDHPDDVRVDRKVDERGVLLTLHVNSQDMGQVVGRQGMTAKSIRALLRIVGIKTNARVNLKIEEPEGGRRYGESQENHETSEAPQSAE